MPKPEPVSQREDIHASSSYIQPENRPLRQGKSSSRDNSKHSYNSRHATDKENSINHHNKAQSESSLPYNDYSSQAVIVSSPTCSSGHMVVPIIGDKHYNEQDQKSSSIAILSRVASRSSHSRDQS